MNLKLLLTTLFLSLCLSCAENAFNPTKTEFSDSRSDRTTTTIEVESDRTLIEPPVDFLFLWDNSSSQVFINSQTKDALNRLIDRVDQRFDYHILMAPLIADGNDHAFFISKDDTQPGNGIPKISRESASSRISQFPTNTNNFENGLQRVNHFLQNNINNNVFRKDAYTIIVMMSNEDDTSYINQQDNAHDRGVYLNEQVNNILCLRGNYSGNCNGVNNSIDSLMMRMISIVAIDDQTCRNSSISRYRLNYLYKETSSRLYNEPYTDNRELPNDQLNSNYIDSYDICKEDYSNIFDGVNSTIDFVLIRHVYNFAAFANSSQLIDPNTIKMTKTVAGSSISFSAIDDDVQITKDNTGKIDRDQNGNRVHGFRYVGIKNNQDTRFLPSAGEEDSGHMIELFGEAKVTYPESINVEVLSPQEFFGFVSVPSKPLESSIVLRINGVDIPKDATNGWQLRKSGNEPLFFRDFNIKIKSNTDRSPETPVLNKTGYMIEVFGNAVYSNGARIEVLYDPAS